MAQKTVATLLILSAFAIAGANSASAEDGGFRGGGFHDGGGGGFHGRSFHKRSSPVIVGGYVGGYGSVGSDGYADNNGSGNGSGDWYGISSGHDGCPLFRQRVMTPKGWRIQMVPVC
jgi:hypothetical protein